MDIPIPAEEAIWASTQAIVRSAVACLHYRSVSVDKMNTDPKQVVAVITDCPAPQYVGKTANAIYKIEAGTLTLTSYGPGNAELPPSFYAPDTRTFVFRKP